MRNIYIGFFGFTLFLGIIIAFENIGTQASGMMIFFDSMTGSLFLPLIFVLFLGMVSGLFLGLAITTKSSKGGDVDDFDI